MTSILGRSATDTPGLVAVLVGSNRGPMESNNTGSVMMFKLGVWIRAAACPTQTILIPCSTGSLETSAGLLSKRAGQFLALVLSIQAILTSSQNVGSGTGWRLWKRCPSK